MLKLRFYLHNKASADGYHPIYLEARWGRTPAAAPQTNPALRLSTGKACTAKNWNAERERPRKDENLTTARLNQLDTLITNAINLASQQQRYVSVEELKAEVLAAIRPQAAAAPTAPEEKDAADLPLAELAVLWVERYRAKHSHSHLRKMKPLADHWERFRPGTTARELLPAKASEGSALVDTWAAYMLEEAPQRNGTFGVDSNSLGDYIKRLRLLIKFAGLPYDWLKDDYSYEKEGEPLTYGEVQQLLTVEGLTPWLSQVRDTFVFACFTGPRFGNLSTLGPEAGGAGGDTLEYVQIKGRRNKRKVRVSLPPVAAEIWARYGGQLPVSCLQDFNRDIKKVARLAGIDRPILKVNYKGTERLERRGPLWEFISSHTARHTYATLLLDGGADLGTVQMSLGHQNIQVTRRYAQTREKSRASATLDAFERLSNSHTQSESVRTGVPKDTTG